MKNIDKKTRLRLYNLASVLLVLLAIVLWFTGQTRNTVNNGRLAGALLAVIFIGIPLLSNAEIRRVMNKRNKGYLQALPEGAWIAIIFLISGKEKKI